LHDPLTRLPNRTLFSDRLEHALSRAERHGSEVAVLFLDLDNFKLVNYSLGHEAGDRLLVEASGRISSCLGPWDTAAYLSGDEFAVLVEVTTRDRATRVARRFA
jgi:diguanylate cyclase (GGDEF)-like protein